MKKILLSVSIVALLMTISASGQRPTRRFCLQDESTGAQLVFLSDGSYTFTACGSGVSTRGVGQVRVRGCRVSLTDVTPSQMIQAELDTCNSAGKASIRIDSCPPAGPGRDPSGAGRIEPICQPLAVTLKDSNLSDSLCACG